MIHSCMLILGQLDDVLQLVGCLLLRMLILNDLCMT